MGSYEFCFLKYNYIQQACAKLKDYETSKKDMKKGVEIVPEEKYFQ